MKMEQVSTNCFAVLNEKSLVCDANSGLINLGGGMRGRSRFRRERKPDHIWEVNQP